MLHVLASACMVIYYINLCGVYFRGGTLHGHALSTANNIFIKLDTSWIDIMSISMTISS